LPAAGPRPLGTFAKNDIWFQTHQFGRVSDQTVGIAGSPAIIDPNVAPLRSTQLSKPLPSRAYQRLCFRIARNESHQHTYPSLALLRARRERPRHSAAEQRDGLASMYLIEWHPTPMSRDR
jgi:hypothetical protein